MFDGLSGFQVSLNLPSACIELDRKECVAANRNLTMGIKFNFDNLIFDVAVKTGRVAMTGAKNKADFLSTKLQPFSSLPCDTLFYCASLLLNKGLLLNTLPNDSLTRASKFCRLAMSFLCHAAMVHQTIIRRTIQDCIEETYENLSMFGEIPTATFQRMQTMQSQRTNTDLSLKFSQNPMSNVNASQISGVVRGKRKVNQIAPLKYCYAYNDGDVCQPGCIFPHICGLCGDSHPKIRCPRAPKRNRANFRGVLNTTQV